MSTNIIPMRGRIPQWTFGERARKARREIGLTQSAMAEKLGVTYPTYSAWETGRNTPADIAGTAVKLERITGVAREWFLGWADESPRPDGPGEGNVSHLSGLNRRPSHYMYEGMAA